MVDYIRVIPVLDTFKLPQALLDEAKAEASRLGISKSVFYRIAIRDLVLGKLDPEEIKEKLVELEDKYGKIQKGYFGPKAEQLPAFAGHLKQHE